MTPSVILSPHVLAALRLRSKRQPVELEAVERLLYETVMSDGGVRTGARSAYRHVAGNCTSPVLVVISSRTPGMLKRRKVRNHHAMVSLDTRCRRCDKCRRYRGNYWRTRAIAETQAAERTWFGTFTFEPQEHYRIELEARSAYGRNWEELTKETQFTALASKAGERLTKWLKRVRKNGGLSTPQRIARRWELRDAGQEQRIDPVAFRYLITCEMHDSVDTSPEMRGRPHFHALIHEGVGHPVRKDGLQEPFSEWGFTSFKLVKNMQGPMYVAKYLSKAADVRIRASKQYGSAEIDDHLMW